MKKKQPILYFATTLVVIACMLSCEPEVEITKQEPIDTTDVEPEPFRDTIPPVLVSYQHINDSILLLFNEPIELIALAPGGPHFGLNFYELSPHFISVSNKHGFKFESVFGYLSGEIPYKYTVRDTVGNEVKDTVTVLHYDKKILFPGRISHYEIDEAKNIGYFLTSETPTFSIFSFATRTIIEQIPLPFLKAHCKENQMAYNPKDNLFYIYSRYCNDPLIYAYSLAEKRVVRTIAITPVPTDDPRDSYTYPQDLEFLSNGVGFMLVAVLNGFEDKLRIINTTDNDKITAIENNRDFVGVEKNWNRSEIYAGRDNFSLGAPIFKLDTTSLQPSYMLADNVNCTSNCLLFAIRPHRQKDKIYIINRREQFITDSKVQSVSKFSHYDAFVTSGYVSADFSYKPEEDSYIYYHGGDGWRVNEGYVHLLDYENARTIATYKADPDMRDLRVSPDTKSFFMRRWEYLYFFDDETFRKTNF